MKLKIILTTFSMCLAFNATAGDILAIKEGPFKKYDKCTLTNSTGTIEAGNSYNYKLLETSKYYDYFYDFEGLIKPVIAGAQTRSHRWSPTQTDYYIKNSSGSLINFYAVGFTNINNNTPEANTLITKMDNICDEQLTDFNILGEFQIDLKIGNEIFEDKLLIKRTKEFFGININGTYIVPNSFESKIQKLNYENGSFSFIIRVQEGEEDYKAIFEGFLHANGELEGKAFILPDRKELGSFTGKRI